MQKKLFNYSNVGCCGFLFKRISTGYKDKSVFINMFILRNLGFAGKLGDLFC